MRTIKNCVIALPIAAFCLVNMAGILVNQPKELFRPKFILKNVLQNFKHSRQYWILCALYSVMYITCVDQVYINSSSNIKYYFYKPIHFVTFYHMSALISSIFACQIVRKLRHRPIILFIENGVVIIFILVSEFEPSYCKLLSFIGLGIFATTINPLTKQIFGAFSKSVSLDFAYFLSILI